MVAMAAGFLRGYPCPAAGAPDAALFLGFGEGFGAVGLDDAAGADEAALEEVAVAAFHAHPRVGAGCMDKFVVADVDARVVAASAATEGQDVAGLELVGTVDAHADGGLLGCGAGQAHAGGPVGPADQAGAVEAARGLAAEAVGRAEGVLGAVDDHVGLAGCGATFEFGGLRDGAPEVVELVAAVGVMFLLMGVAAAQHEGNGQNEQEGKLEFLVHR